MSSITNCIRKIKNSKIDNAKDNDVVMPMYNSIKYSDNYSKTYGSSQQYYKDKPALNDPGAIANFPDDNVLFE